jgi:hypothetical membrane protein
MTPFQVYGIIISLIAVVYVYFQETLNEWFGILWNK